MKIMNTIKKFTAILICAGIFAGAVIRTEYHSL